VHPDLLSAILRTQGLTRPSLTPPPSAFLP
jgi:hypothetical protein